MEKKIQNWEAWTMTKKKNIVREYFIYGLNKHKTTAQSVRSACLSILGFNPIQAQIVTQIGGVFVLPLSIGAMIYLVNRKDLMGPHHAGWVLNIGLLTSFLFSIYITYTGYIAIAERLRNLL